MANDKKKIPNKKSIASISSRTNQRKNTKEGRVKKSVSKKPSLKNSISKSKKLAEKLQKTKANCIRKSKSSSPTNEEPRICGNGKPMPSLADLEKMFEDSDNDEEPKVMTPTKPKPMETVNTSEMSSPIKAEELTSPRVIEKIANKMMEIITNLPDSTIQIDEGPPPPIVPPKKRKKPDVPYIVGCKDRPQVPYNPSVNFCKGDDYGIENNKGDDKDECPQKRAKRTKAVNLSKSRFNVKSDEIAAWLKDCDKAEQSDSSSDSNKTVEYAFSGRPQSFSPQPSTSRDDVTISQNDKKFNESLLSAASNNSSPNIEIDNNIQETILIGDEIDSTEVKIEKLPEASLNTKKDINEEPIVIDDEVCDNYRIRDIKKIETDDCLEIISDKQETHPRKKVDNSDIIDLDDYYKFKDTDFVCDIPEIIDIDDVIAENKAIIEKYSKVEKLNSVTNVDSNMISGLSNERNQPKATESEEIRNNTTINVNSVSDDIISARNTGTDGNPPNDIANQIQSIVTNYFNKQSHNTDSLLGMVMSKYGEMSYRLLNNLTSWLNSFSVPTTCTRNTDNIGNAHLAQASESLDNDVIVITDNSMPQQTNLHNTDLIYPTNSSSVNNRVSSTVQLPVRQVQLPRRRRRNRAQRPNLNRINSNHMQNANQFFSTGQEVPGFQNLLQVQSPDTTVAFQTVLHNMPQQTTVAVPPCPHPADPPVNSGSLKKSIGDCPICMDSLANNPVASTICGHVFCMGCIKASISSNGKKCPTCRKSLKGVGYHPLFL